MFASGSVVSAEGPTEAEDGMEASKNSFAGVVAAAGGIVPGEVGPLASVTVAMKRFVRPVQSFVDRAVHIPLRLSYDERKKLRLVESALVSTMLLLL